MRNLLKSKKNNILLLKNYKKIKATPVLSLKDIFNKYYKNDIVSFDENLYQIKDVLIFDNCVSSPITTANNINLYFDFLSPIKRKYKKKYLVSEKKSILDFCENKLFTDSKVLLKYKNNSIEISQLEDIENVWDDVIKNSPYIFIEKVIEGDLFKVFVNDSGVLAVYSVVPAHIIGNGIDTVEKLINDLNITRGKNILYKDYKVLVEYENLDYVPIKGEIIKLNESLSISEGASFIDLSYLLNDVFYTLFETLKESLLKINYLEISCYSKDIFSRTSENIIITDVKQNKADLRFLFSCCNHTTEMEFFSSRILGQEKLETQLEKANILSNNHYFSDSSQTYLLKEAANRLGLGVEFLKKNLIKVTDINRNRSVLFQSGMSQYTSYQSRVISNNKFYTKRFLGKLGVNTPNGVTYNIKDKELAKKKLDFSSIKKWVLKPLSGSGGAGVSTSIEDSNSFEMAWNICKKESARDVLLEEQVSGNDYRVVVIKNSICAVTQRTAAYVVGNGIDSIRKLINIKAEERKKNPYYKLKVFAPNDVMISFLKKNGIDLDYIPAQFEKIQLLEAVNIGSGGESIDRTDEVHSDWSEVMIKVRKAILKPYHMGVDLMAEDISKSPYAQKWSIIEVNTNPDLGLQLFPEIGKPRDIAACILLSIFGDLSHLRKTAFKVIMIGKVQGVGFRKWLKSICEERSICGVVCNSLKKNSVEAVISGYEATLDEVLELIYEGPKNAVVRQVIIEELDEFEKYNSLKSFEILDTI